MSMTRAQLEEQIRGFANGGTPDPFQGYLTPAPSAAGTPNTNPLRGYLTPPLAAPAPTEEPDEDEFMRRLMLLREALQASQTPSSLTVPDFDERFGQYQTQLRNVMGPQQRSNIFDLASTVGRTMLASDPTAGAFSSLGLGLSEFDAQQRKTRDAQRAEDRAVAMKAFELAQSDVKSAQDFLNQYELAKAKQNQDNKIDFYTVQDPNGITLGSRLYKQGEQIPLNPTEALSVREKIGQAGSGGISIPTSGAAATYMSREDAEATVESLGLSRASENFDRAVEQITAKTPDQIGRPVIVSGSFGELRPIEQNDVVSNIIISPSADAGKTGYETFKEAQRPLVAKALSTYNEAATGVLPQVEFALNLVLDPNTDTGAFQELLLPLKRLFVDAFGSIDQGIQNLDSLEAIANSLGPKMRPTGSGSTSDREFAAYKQALLSLGNTDMANYLSLYRFKKITENAIALNQLETRLFADDRITDYDTYEKLRSEFDAGIWEKWTGDPTNQAAVTAWHESLPIGAVILNRDINGDKLFDTDEVYIIKGWPKEKK